ncbi:MAG: hypothetical protein AAF192_15830, partial [Pseudomonadota bacterium]
PGRRRRRPVRERSITSAETSSQRGSASTRATAPARPGAEEVEAPRFLAFHAGAAGFPWRSQAVWIASRLARRNGLDAQEAAAAARACFRPDLYRAALAPHGADLPGASEKVEGALHRESPVASSRGEMFLGPDAFFDGKEFDPDCP